MRFTVTIDDELLGSAIRAGGCKSKHEAITAAFEEYVGRRERAKLSELVGTMEFEADHLARLDASSQPSRV